jgi:hypothetical protein
MNPNYETAATSVLPPSSHINLPTRELLIPLPTPGHFLMVIDNSTLEKVKRCHAAGAYYSFYAREAHARNAALGFGGAIHVGLECIERDEGKTDVVLQRTGEVLKWSPYETAQQVIQFFCDNPQPPDEYRTPQTALEVLAHYRERRTLPDFQWNVLSDTSGLLIEQPFEVPLGVLEIDTEIQLPHWEQPRHVSHIHVAWSGRIDLVAETNGFNRVVDHKTTSIAGDQFVQSFQISSQTLGYVWVARQLWPDLDIQGFCLNAIHLKKPSPGRSLVEPGPRGGPAPLNFFRAYFEYSPQRLSQWADDTITLIEDFVHSMVRGHFPLNDHGCFNRYGVCPYFDVCTIDDIEVRKRMLFSDAYKNVTWNPTHGR